MINKLYSMYTELSEETLKMIMNNVDRNDETFKALEELRLTLYNTIKTLDNQ